MEEKIQTNAGQGFGIAALILGIITLLTAIIPCVGILALVPGILGIIFAVIALMQASQHNGAKALIIVALVLASLGTAISATWAMVLSTPAIMTNTVMKTFRNAVHFDDLTKSLEDLDKNIDHEINKTKGSYTITIKKTNSATQDTLVKKLEELEGGDTITVNVDTVIRK